MFAPCTSSESRGSPHVGRLISFSCVALALLAVDAIRAHPSQAQIVINNGLAPPNPDNVIDASDPDLRTHVRNVDCPPEGSDFWEPCPSPGALSTHVEIVEGAFLSGSCPPNEPFYENSARDSSKITVSEGGITCLTARESGRLHITGGSFGEIRVFDQSVTTIEDIYLPWYLIVRNDATVRIGGGQIAYITANSSVPIIINGGDFFSLYSVDPGGYIVEGANFELDGVPVEYGEYTLPADGTVLTGTLASGENFSPNFVNGPITLRPPTPAVPALRTFAALALAMALFVIGAMQLSQRCADRQRGCRA